MATKPEAGSAAQIDHRVAIGCAAFKPKVPGVYVLPNSNNLVDMGRLVGGDLRGIIVETITGGGGQPDACDQLPDGTIIVSP